ncbi:MAG: HU family DNA-binding protein [Bacillota bacterium]|nr:HU family DNA-binding protein [Bacillota bacterium]
MNKAEIVTAVAERTGFSKKDTETTINEFIKAIEKELCKDNGKVQLIGFGTFETRARKSRMGRNPKKPTEEVFIPASKAPVFKAGKALKDAVNAAK